MERTLHRGLHGLRASGAVRLAACVAFALLVCVAAWVPRRAYAAGVGSLTLDCSLEYEGTPVSFTGDAFSLTRVAAVEVGSEGLSYTTLEAFEGLDRDWSALDAQGVRDVGVELEAHARGEGLLGNEAPVDASNQVRWYGLEPGLYLAVRTTVLPEHAAWIGVPALVSIPLIEDGSLSYSPVAHPKFEYVPDGGDPQEPDGTPDDEGPGSGPLDDLLESLGLPQTGDAAWAPMLLLALGGCALLWWGRVRSRRGQPDGKTGNYK